MAAGQIALDRAYLVAIWLETLLYGFNACLFGSYVYITRVRPARRRVAPVIFWIAVLMFCFSTVHVSLGLARLIWGFIDHRDDPGGPQAFFSDVSQPPNVAKVIIHTINSILGDSIVVWRCYYVWAMSWKICVLPALLILGSAICGFGQAYIFATAKTTHSAFATSLARWNGSLFSLSFATNALVTALIAVRLWFLTRDINRNMLSGHSFRYMKVFMLIIESAMIYSAAVLIEIVLYFTNSNAFYIVYDPIAQLTAIVPTLIILIATLGLTVEDLGASKSRDRSGLGASSAPPGGAPAELSTIHFKSMWTSAGGASTTGYSDTDAECEAAESVSVTACRRGDGSRTPDDGQGAKPNLSAEWRLPG
ncbi:hypothetical protein L226DRAFT_510298 [Lentinus tigrinus ALCF2SS1-7]|uniref:Uncharacterized protein n=1 Tax=Lentinus tigrinus ALCF2SS1-6 TaxID=1328759 RepID=A0A5C2S7G8_9APHY|nr:hypothetical protein L227DRAFT_164572 [Lentinus tigrinus ALCF2SS1-6]RPD73495.1 hypothetical protein L226DRAFT_510298 [Lentinus tigrinus ALCF2SS1-7]